MLVVRKIRNFPFIFIDIRISSKPKGGNKGRLAIIHSSLPSELLLTRFSRARLTRKDRVGIIIKFWVILRIKLQIRKEVIFSHRQSDYFNMT